MTLHRGMPRLKDADPRNPRRLLRIGGERWSEQDKGKGQSAEMHYAAPAFSAWRQASRIHVVATLCWPPKCPPPHPPAGAGGTPPPPGGGGTPGAPGGGGPRPPPPPERRPPP